MELIPRKHCNGVHVLMASVAPDCRLHSPKMPIMMVGDKRFGDAFVDSTVNTRTRKTKSKTWQKGEDRLRTVWSGLVWFGCQLFLDRGPFPRGKREKT